MSGGDAGAVIELNAGIGPGADRRRDKGEERPPLRLVRDGESTAVPALSPREIEVLLEWFRSDTKALAAANLFISPGTLNTHLARIRRKYVEAGRPATTKAALVVRALQDGLCSLDDW